MGRRFAFNSFLGPTENQYFTGDLQRAREDLLGSPETSRIFLSSVISSFQCFLYEKSDNTKFRLSKTSKTTDGCARNERLSRILLAGLDCKERAFEDSLMSLAS